MTVSKSVVTAASIRARYCLRMTQVMKTSGPGGRYTGAKWNGMEREATSPATANWYTVCWIPRTAPRVRGGASVMGAMEFALSKDSFS